MLLSYETISGNEIKSRKSIAMFCYRLFRGGLVSV